MNRHKSAREDQSILLPDGRRLGFAEYGAPERPGYGLSDSQPGRSMLDWPDDIAALTDALGVERFAILGFSMGSTYALACAYKLPDRVTKMALVGALAPLDAPGVMEGMSPAVGGLYSLAQSNPGELRNTFTAIASSPDVKFSDAPPRARFSGVPR